MAAQVSAAATGVPPEIFEFKPIDPLESLIQLFRGFCDPLQQSILLDRNSKSGCFSCFPRHQKSSSKNRDNETLTFSSPASSRSSISSSLSSHHSSQLLHDKIVTTPPLDTVKIFLKGLLEDFNTNRKYNSSGFRNSTSEMNDRGVPLHAPLSSYSELDNLEDTSPQKNMNADHEDYNNEIPNITEGDKTKDDENDFQKRRLDRQPHEEDDDDDGIILFIPLENESKYQSHFLPVIALSFLALCLTFGILQHIDADFNIHDCIKFSPSASSLPSSSGSSSLSSLFSIQFSSKLGEQRTNTNNSSNNNSLTNLLNNMNEGYKILPTNIEAEYYDGQTLNPYNMDHFQ